MEYYERSTLRQLGNAPTVSTPIIYIKMINTKRKEKKKLNNFLFLKNLALGCCCCWTGA
jgi:hypothetical protein